MSAILAAPRRLTDLAGIGPEMARKLREIGVATPADLARVAPRDYKDWRTVPPIAETVRRALAAPGEAFETIALGTIAGVRDVRTRIAITNAMLDDGTGTIVAAWFGRRGLSGRLHDGDRLFLHGRVAVKRSKGALRVELNVMHHRRLDDGEVYCGRIVPIYPATKELSSRAIASTIEKNADQLADLVEPVVPEPILARHGFPALARAWREMHAPATPESAAAARRALLFGEFFVVAAGAALRRAERASETGAPELAPDVGLIDTFERTVGLTLTGAQRRAIAEIFADMERGSPMNRLVQGDVGSGKTLVAAAAIVRAARAGVQSALMAPTEILATQHVHKLAPLLLPLGIRTESLFGSMSARAKAAVRDRLAAGECDLVVGTHALLTDGVEFARLGLAVIDEQHRFGTAQRAKLRAKSRAPHTLHMTATPIPRTLTQTRYADLDISVIDELPPGRTPVETFVLRASRIPRAYEFVRKIVAAGQQAYVVAPAIEADGENTLTSAIAELERVRSGPLAGLRIGLVHGRLASREKDATMTAFARGELDVLLATTVVEVGVDVANASVMVVLDAHRYGLAQLHQLRGRVGRGAARSYCILIAPDERGEVERLEVLARTNDGFVIAEEDLRLRGAGDISGALQSGHATLFADIAREFSLYAQAKQEADALVLSDPELERPDHAVLRSAVDAQASSLGLQVQS